MPGVAQLEPSDRYKVWQIESMGKVNDRQVRRKKRLSLLTNRALPCEHECNYLAPPPTLSVPALPRVYVLSNSRRIPQARELLEAVASQVQPILRRRKWTVPLLSEFYPQRSNLLVQFFLFPRLCLSVILVLS